MIADCGDIVYNVCLSKSKRKHKYFEFVLLARSVFVRNYLYQIRTCSNLNIRSFMVLLYSMYSLSISAMF